MRRITKRQRVLATLSVPALVAVPVPARAQLTIIPVAVSGQPAAGAPAGVTYGSFRLAATPSEAGVYANVYDGGMVAFEAGLAGPGVTAANDRALFAGSRGTLNLFAREGSPAPGLPSGTYYSTTDNQGTASWGVYDLTDDGHVVFSTALAEEGVTEQTRQALFAGPLAAPTLLARRGQQAPGAEPGVTYGGLYPVAINPDGHVVLYSDLWGPLPGEYEYHRH
jgi:hypothetical protein